MNNTFLHKFIPNEYNRSEGLFLSKVLGYAFPCCVWLFLLLIVCVPVPGSFSSIFLASITFLYFLKSLVIARVRICYGYLLYFSIVFSVLCGLILSFDSGVYLQHTKLVFNQLYSCIFCTLLLFIFSKYIRKKVGRFSYE